MGYVHVGVDDDGSRRSDDWFDEGVSGALALLALTDGDVLVHCHMGINRGPSMAFAVLLALGWQPLAALGAIRAARPIAAISYADDALAWWARTQGLSATEVQALRRGVRRWERANDLDPGTVIRQIRLAS